MVIESAVAASSDTDTGAGAVTARVRSWLEVKALTPLEEVVARTSTSYRVSGARLGRAAVVEVLVVEA